jgi:hypothetical protein
MYIYGVATTQGEHKDVGTQHAAKCYATANGYKDVSRREHDYTTALWYRATVIATRNEAGKWIQKEALK